MRPRWRSVISVVVDAYGDSLEDLLALDIRIVPPIAAD